MDQLLWYLFAGTRGGPNRFRIVDLLRDRPYNAHQIAQALRLDYRTVRHHLRILVRNGVLTNPGGDRYASMYFLGGLTQESWGVAERIRASLAAPGASVGRTGIGETAPRLRRRAHHG